MMVSPSKTADTGYTTPQKKMLLALASAVGLRMLGLFLVLPVFTLYALEFTSSRLLAGVAFGCYGAAVALTAIPMGRLSDHIGRRKVLLLGMTIFGLGSVICAVPVWFPSPIRIDVLIAGRFVQGLGTITAAAFATVADHFPSERRSTAMAVLGIPIGGAFALGVIGGPLIAGFLSLQWIFWITAALAFATVGLLAAFLPDAPPRPAAVAPITAALRSKPLIALDAGGFLMNVFMTAFWFYLPLILTRKHHLKMSRFYIVLLPMLVVSGFTMFAFSRGADRGKGRPAGAFAFLLMAVSGVLLFRPQLAALSPSHLWSVLVPGALFFIGYTGLEPILPSLVSEHAHESAYGTALGSFQTFQYLGSFAGGALAGAFSVLPTSVSLAFLLTAGLLGFVLMIAAPRH
ncbi:MAG: MFS transporter [Acidobacteriota bacterium]|nr:MFS transporter [Acidobacteriota bacterium]